MGAGSADLGRVADDLGLMSASWESFCEALQQESRHVFVLNRSHDNNRNEDEAPATSVLRELGGVVDGLGLLRVLPAGCRLWRARAHESPSIGGSAKELGTVPEEMAFQANRLSPAGIAMFYGAEDVETAVREIAVRGSANWVTFGQFETSRSCTVVDFSSFSAILSGPPLSQGQYAAGERHPLVFVRSLVSQLSRPARERRERIDYIPTQVVTEHLLHVYGRERPVRGMLYSSALTGRLSMVLDIPNGCCVEQGPGWAGVDELRLGLVPGSVRTTRLDDMRTG